MIPTAGLTPREEIVSGMMMVNMLSMPFRAIDAGIEMACNNSKTIQGAFQWTAEKIQSVIDSVPDSYKASVNKTLGQMQERNQNLAEAFEAEFDIPKEDTAYFLESSGHVLGGLASIAVGGAVGKVAGKVLMESKRFVSKAGSGVSQLFKTPAVSEPMKMTISLENNSIKGSLNLVTYRPPEGPLAIFVDSLRAAENVTFGESTKTFGTLALAMRKIKEVARQYKMSEVTVQFASGNERLTWLAVGTKKLDFLGSKYPVVPTLEKLSQYSLSNDGLYPTFTLHVSPLTPMSKNYLAKVGALMGPPSIALFPFSDAREPNTVERPDSDNRTFNVLMGRVVIPDSPDHSASNLASTNEQEQQLFEQQSAEETLVSRMQELSLSDEPSATEAPPAVSLDLNLTHPKRAALSMEGDLGSNVSARINVVPLHLRASTVTVTAPLSDNFSGSFNLNPVRPQNSSVGFSFSQEGVTGGVLIPVTSPEHMQVTVGGTIPGLGSANISLPISDPLRARVNVEVPFTCVGVPLVGKASVSLRHPENAKIGLAVSTFGLDKVLPIGLPSQISILSINCKKVRHKLQSLGHKAGICSNSHKKRRKKQKAAELKAEIELFHASRKAFQERQEEIKQATELHFQKMLEEAVENVDIAYTPVLVEEMEGLGRDLHTFLDQLNELQAALSELELPNLERDPLRLRVEELVWNEGAWESMFARGREAIDGLNQIIDLTERLDNFCNEFTPAIEKCLEESERLTQQYEETERAFRQTEATAQALAARQQQIAAWLRNNVPQNVLQEAAANLGAHQ